MQVKAFKNEQYPDGRIVFDLAPSGTMRVIVICEGFIRQVPECLTFEQGSSTNTFFVDLLEFISRTQSITLIDGVEADDTLLELMNFWQEHGRSAHYRATWEAFLLCNQVIHDEWAVALNESDAAQAQLKAPALIRPNAPTDDELDKLPDGSKKKRNGTRSLKESTSTQPISPVV